MAGDGRLPVQENACKLRVGRVVEVRIRRLANLDEMQWLTTEVFAAIDRAGPGAVIGTDCRLAFPVGRHVARAWSRAMRKANDRIARSAFLLDPANTMFNLQLERIVDCALNPARRCFAQLDQFRDWIGAALSEPERQAVNALFSDDD
jgi:hypothetical protein